MHDRGTQKKHTKNTEQNIHKKQKGKVGETDYQAETKKALEK
jgi:hypothetical protein